ncbi:cupin domain-containing protein [Pseudooceanicola sp. CBS1P-1]|uniref:Allophanate hydrolase n=1 Tax=Pseudooceanicola albus TaxID=2692189 RepID=A0A6L7G479_9RHOB|nr:MULTISPECIES: cupin domain-containing protein [Pseudooceanicola]MBT9385216.1 cupin domain-containing protein [Pseudooceanicola endophyticus]MXN18492.1 allophanate hydrolase [Pseudooceanicola albus]
MPDPQFFPALIPSGWRDLPFQPFLRAGVEVHYLWQTEEGPVWALLRYAPGASVPRHLHTGLETILVLEGSQSDEHGCYGPGTLVCNPAGTVHSVWSEEGCTILIQWESPVQLLD